MVNADDRTTSAASGASARDGPSIATTRLNDALLPKSPSRYLCRQSWIIDRLNSCRRTTSSAVTPSSMNGRFCDLLKAGCRIMPDVEIIVGSGPLVLGSARRT
jgi:hypothetical protein